MVPLFLETPIICIWWSPESIASNLMVAMFFIFGGEDIAWIRPLIFRAWVCLGALKHPPRGQIGHILAVWIFFGCSSKKSKTEIRCQQTCVFFVLNGIGYNSQKGFCIQKPGDFVFYRCYTFLKLADHLMIINVDLLAVRSNQGSEHSK